MFCHVKLFIYSHHQVSSKFHRINISNEKAQNHRIQQGFRISPKNLDEGDLIYRYLIILKVV